MLNVLNGKKIKQESTLKIDPRFKKIIIDLGCGDGKQTYKLAYDHPENFYIGIDANFKALEEISRKAKKKPAKGGLNNLMYIHGVAENLPIELESIADEVQVNFPWGSLLEGIVSVNTVIIQNLVLITKNTGVLQIITTYDDKYEEAFRAERNLPELSLGYFEDDFKKAILNFGIKIMKVKVLDENEKASILSPWGKKILSKRDREVYSITGVVVK